MRGRLLTAGGVRGFIPHPPGGLLALHTSKVVTPTVTARPPTPHARETESPPHMHAKNDLHPPCQSTAVRTPSNALPSCWWPGWWAALRRLFLPEVYHAEIVATSRYAGTRSLPGSGRCRRRRWPRRKARRPRRAALVAPLRGCCRVVGGARLADRCAPTWSRAGLAQVLWSRPWPRTKRLGGERRPRDVLLIVAGWITR